MTLAGFPATTARGGTSFVTTLPAPTTARSPTMMPHSNVALDPMEAPRLTTVRVPHVERGGAMVRCIVDRLPDPGRGARPPVRIGLAAEIVRRESTGPVGAPNWPEVLGRMSAAA